MSAYFRRLFSILVVLLFAVTPDKLFSAADRPNILWILSEDNSIHYMRLYGDSLGIMPNVERLASRGLTFEHALSSRFANSSE